jgi:hypothetical protein
VVGDGVIDSDSNGRIKVRVDQNGSRNDGVGHWLLHSGLNRRVVKERLFLRRLLLKRRRRRSLIKHARFLLLLHTCLLLTGHHPV